MGAAATSITDAKRNESELRPNLKLAKKLAEVMGEIGYVQKRGKNAFHGYNYVKAADLAHAVRSRLASRNVIMLSDLVSSETREISANDGKVMQFCDVILSYTFHDGDTGESFSFRCPGSGADRGDKAVYKALTGSLKYAIRNAFLVPDESDPEADSKTDRDLEPDKKLQGHTYKTVWNGKNVEFHDFEHKSHEYCPQCKKDFEKLPPTAETGPDTQTQSIRKVGEKSPAEVSGREPPAPTQDKKKPDTIKAFLGDMVKAKEHLGKDVYYTILGANGVEHANELRTNDARKKVHQAMQEAYLDRKKSQPKPDLSEMMLKVCEGSGRTADSLLAYLAFMVHGDATKSLDGKESIMLPFVEAMLKKPPDEVRSLLAKYESELF